MCFLIFTAKSGEGRGGGGHPICSSSSHFRTRCMILAGELPCTRVGFDWAGRARFGHFEASLQSVPVNGQIGHAMQQVCLRRAEIASWQVRDALRRLGQVRSQLERGRTGSTASENSVRRMSVILCKWLFFGTRKRRPVAGGVFSALFELDCRNYLLSLVSILKP